MILQGLKEIYFMLISQKIALHQSFVTFTVQLDLLVYMKQIHMRLQAILCTVQKAAMRLQAQ